jgi:hypothetical protein
VVAGIKASETAVQTDLEMSQIDRLTGGARSELESQNISQPRHAGTHTSETASRGGRNPNRLNPITYSREGSPQLSSALAKVETLSNQLPHANFRDNRINETVLLSGPPNIDSDSDFNRGSSMMANFKQKNQNPQLQFR